MASGFLLFGSLLFWPFYPFFIWVKLSLSVLSFLASKLSGGHLEDPLQKVSSAHQFVMNNVVTEKGNSDNNDSNADSVIHELRLRLVKERAARDELSRELEEERGAAAAAVDEAVAAILRLQMDKAAMEMEVRAGERYQTLLEEKSARDEEQMNFLITQMLNNRKECNTISWCASDVHPLQKSIV